MPRAFLPTLLRHGDFAFWELLNQVKDFWSVIVYDNQTRSMVQTDQKSPSLSSQNKALNTNTDGSVDVYFGPHPPTGLENNWVQTLPGKGWFMILRLYGPLETWFDKTWRPREIELQPKFGGGVRMPHCSTSRPSSIIRGWY